MAKFLNKKSILEAPDLKPVELEIPEWDGCILVRGATAQERDEYEAKTFRTRMEDDKTVTEQDLTNAKAEFVVKCILNEDGSRMFSDTDAKLLGAKSNAAVNRIFQKVAELSGIGRKAQKELEKNSASPTSDSSTPSPGTSK